MGCRSCVSSRAGTAGWRGVWWTPRPAGCKATIVWASGAERVQTGGVRSSRSSSRTIGSPLLVRSLTGQACRWAIAQIRREHASVNGIRWRRPQTTGSGGPNVTGSLSRRSCSPPAAEVRWRPGRSQPSRGQPQARCCLLLAHRLRSPPDCRPPPTVEPAHPLKPGVWVTVNMQVQGYPYERREPPSHRHCTPRARRVKSDCYSVVDTSTVLPPSLLGFTGTVCLKLASQIGAAHCR